MSSGSPRRVPVITRLCKRLRRRWRRALKRQQGPVYLISAGGQPNFGDEFITRAWLDWLAEHHPEREVWLDTIEPGRAAHLFRDTHPRLRTTNTLWRLAHTGPDDIEAASERMVALITGLGSPRDDFGLRDLRRMESMHLIGGGYMNSIWPENLAILTAMTAVRAEYGARLIATGQGLLPSEPATADFVRSRLADFDYVEARDDESAEAFEIPNGDDDAFLAFANRRPVYAPPDTLPGAMVLVQGDLVDEDVEPRLGAEIEHFVSEHGGAADVAFAEAIPPDDASRAMPYVEAGAGFFPFMRIWDEGFPARPGQTWLTSRFHFHLLAAAAGADGIVVDVRPGYYTVKHDSLRALGTGWTVTSAGDGDAEPASDARFPARARRIGRRKSSLARRLCSTRAPR